MMYLRKSATGFSLVEIMVVVAIIGILATIALPAYKRFQIRARQAESKHSLSLAFTAEKTAKAEYNTYISCLGSFGFDLFLRWNCVDDGANPQSVKQYYSTQVNPDDGDATWGNTAVSNSGYPCISGIYDCSPSRWFFKSIGYAKRGNCNGGGNGVWDQTEIMGLDSNYTYLTANTFKIVASGLFECPAPIGNYTDFINYADIWTIDENRTLRNVKPAP